MRSERRSKSWWRETVARWKRSGLSAKEFAAREGVSARTLSWWSSAMRRGTRAERGMPETAMTPIEIALPTRAATQHAEIAVAGAVVRVEIGADLDYVCELVRRLAARS